jgi:hypothetical protein
MDRWFILISITKKLDMYMFKRELKAIYRYLKSLEPVSNKVDATVVPPGDE